MFHVEGKWSLSVIGTTTTSYDEIKQGFASSACWLFSRLKTACDPCNCLFISSSRTMPMGDWCHATLQGQQGGVNRSMELKYTRKMITLSCASLHMISHWFDFWSVLDVVLYLVIWSDRHYTYWYEKCDTEESPWVKWSSSSNSQSPSCTNKK